MAKSKLYGTCALSGILRRASRITRVISPDVVMAEDRCFTYYHGDHMGQQGKEKRDRYKSKPTIQ